MKNSCSGLRHRFSLSCSPCLSRFLPFFVLSFLAPLALFSGLLSPSSAFAADVVHSLTFLDGSPGLPGATAADVEAAKTFDPGAPCQGLPRSGEHLVKAGVYKAMDCLVQGDRFEYWADDMNGQFLFILPARKEGSAGGVALRIVLSALDAQGQERAQVFSSAAPAAFNKGAFLVDMTALKPGAYKVTAAWADAAGATLPAEGGGPVPAAEYIFAKSDKRNPVVPIPEEGIPINLEEQKRLTSVVWPVRAGVPLPINAVTDVSRLALFENGKPIPAQIRSRATWHPKGSVKWLHVDFLARYVGGRPAQYRLKAMSAPSEPAKTALTWNATGDEITVDTGALKFVVNRKRFAGIERAWYDPAGKGCYADEQFVIGAPGGPYMVDGRMIRFEAMYDREAEVVVEEAGPVRVTIRAEGWYQNPENRVKPICRFQTRIMAYAGLPMLRVVQSTILAYDTRECQIKDLGFAIKATENDDFRLGADGKVYEGALGKQVVWLHQDRYDHFRLMGAKAKVARDESPFIEGERSDGWFTVGRKGADMTVILKDVWQKFPKEVEMSRDGLTLHFWPAHGHRAFRLEDELAIGNIYKFWCFHQGALLDLRLPNDYFEKFSTDYASGTFECRPEHALNGNARGAVIGNEFVVLFSPTAQRKDAGLAARKAQEQDDILGETRRAVDPARFAGLVLQDPASSAPPEWNCSTGAMGRIGAADYRRFPAMEEAVEKGFLSHTRCVERGKEWGMWNYADTHTYWDVENDRAQLHRVWHNSHYHEMGMTWLMYYRTGSPDLLRWARASTDHWMNVDTINWTDPEKPLKFHAPGAMYHCKGLTHWGGEAYGMERRDGHAGVAGHWTDPDAFLWAWYLGGVDRAWDVYRIWAASYAKSPWHAGTRREANTTLANMMNYYQASWDPNMLTAIRGMGLSLRTHEPLENQNPGPMWHPLWMNRYYEHARDPEYVPFILQYARRTQLADTWTTALAALAYDLSGDKTYLTAHFPRIHRFPRLFYRRPGDPYDWYGIGPGPLGSRWGAYFCWGHFVHALNKAGIMEITGDESDRFGYLVGGKPSLTALALEDKDRPFHLTFDASSLGGDLHQCTVNLFSPSGKLVADFKVPPRGGPSRWVEKREIPPDGETGVYRFTLQVYQATVRAPLTDHPFEAAIVPKNVGLQTGDCYGWLCPSDPTQPVELEISSGGPHVGRACSVRVEDAKGRALLEDSLFKPRGRVSASITLDPAKHPLPWKIDVLGSSVVRWTGSSDALLLGPSDEALRAILAAMGKVR